MCTVTFIRVNNSFFLTSNRDEKVQRSQALPPRIYQQDDGALLYPKDADAGGTWIALNDNLNAAVLLNGAFVNHPSQAPYLRSRGLVLIDILAAPSPFDRFLQIQLEGVEPFTLILFENFKLYECRWDSTKKYNQQLGIDQNYIWSSATLYNQSAQTKRADWFEKWQRNHTQPLQADIFHFHQFAGDGDERNDIRMNREGELFTVSITGIQVTKHTGTMNYLDLKDGATYIQKFIPSKIDVA